MHHNIKFEEPYEARYTDDYAKQYYYRHKRGFFKKISNWLEQRMIKKALKLAGSPRHVADLPCGAGRFWETILKNGASFITGIDISPSMLTLCQTVTPWHILKYVTLLEGSATNIPLDDKSVETLLCIRLLHHIHDPAVRYSMYQEFQRVTQKTVCLSFWIDNNFKSWRNQGRPGKNPYLSAKTLEAELIQSGFNIVGKIDMLPYYLPWRMYILELQ